MYRRVPIAIGINARARACGIAIALTVLALAAAPALADEIHPGIYVLVDTSGSMLETPAGINTYGDGSLEHDHAGVENSRLYMAKEALTTVIYAYGEVRWGLARFKQNEGWNYFCMCHSDPGNHTTGPCSPASPGLIGEVGPTGAPVCEVCDMFTPYPDYDLEGQNDRVCINYAGGIYAGCTDPHTAEVLDGADILVPLAEDNEPEILAWIDHAETDFPGGTDKELRAVGGTPIGGSLQDLYNALANGGIGGDPLKGCRPYSIIVLTDGANSCATNPVTWAGNLRTVPDMTNTCASDAECPLNSTCDTTNYAPGRCLYEVKTYVIGFALSAFEFQKASLIASAGGTGPAIEAWNQDDIAAAMAEIIADSIRPELCDGVDNDCDGETDEDFPVGQACNNGLLGQCNADGSYICNPTDPTGVVCDALGAAPSAEVCDGLDNDCDGQIDEDGVCTCNGPELCNGFDDYCDNWTTAPEGSEDPNVNQPCGTDIGRCTTGITYCWQDPGDPTIVALRCSGVGPIAEVCDANSEDNDQNCNGINNDGIAPLSCQKTNPNGTCDGLRTCDEAGAWTCWAKDPAPEVCNNVDDDCDTQVDEGLSQPCQSGNGFGTCPGTEVCVAGAWVNCDAPTPAAESCNNADDNCNGQVDEGLSRSCQVPNAFGICTGTETCSAGAWVGCTAATPAAEICNNLDDDCDGQIDESVSRACYTGTAGTENVGLCRGGTQSCAAGVWGSCAGQVTPATELCDNLDNDCDGQVDEGLGQTTCGLGICSHTVQNCVGGAPQSCDPLQGATTETCNGLDDNCDGVVDGLTEGCYPFASGCTETSPGVWSCQGTCAAGTRACPVGAGAWGACQFARGPSGEVCDNQDNDCDGQIDEGLTEACYPLGYGPTTGCTAPGTCLGACAEGSRTCGAGAWSACGSAVTPTAEVCDGIDNDCDGQIDEGLSRACQITNPNGTCGGVETCTNGAWGGCTAVTPGPETCNNVDDDCDGQVDENLSRACQITNPNGTCTGTETCQTGAWVGCTAATPAAEICNNADDNCNGQTDENLSQSCYNGPAGTAGVGLCTAGTRACTAGAWGSCSGEATPATEICDGLDNDCDGQTDEGLGQTTCGLGICNHTVQNCVSGAPQSCDPLQGATTETCNGLDDNCDGVVDGLSEACFPFASGCTETSPGVWSCQGTCQAGNRTCPAGGAGNWGTCQLAVGPATEVCDNQDNDCDGLIDEGLSQACYPPGYGPNTGCTGPGTCLGVCAEGNRTCAAGSWGACGSAVTPSPETCDNLDNDCDGQVDEGLSRTCQVTNTFGTCTGMEACGAGAWGTCNAATPAAEICNNLDDDCDGQVDEGVNQACYTGPANTEGVGACHGGTQNCTAGSFGACQGQVTPSAEVCDGIDNDCDGLIDEDANGNPLAEACYTGPAGTEGVGTCHGGTRVCTSGAWGPCQGEVPPAAEQCDGLDNDCDGPIDEDLGQTTCGLGTCAHTVDNCVNGVPQACNPYQGAQPEVCDGLDNDCDGVVDGIARTCYGFATGCSETTPGNWSCAGTCAPGIQVCPAAGPGTWGECEYDVGPSAEVCDGQDNDCDGLIDEDANDAPLSQTCYPPGSGPNTGCTWNAAQGSWACLGTCAAGTRECSGGLWGGCNGHVTPTVETCDGTDNDCDGIIDEEEDIPGLNLPCSTALGRCTPGILRCVNGQELCEGGAGPFPGDCNGEDDDCDGEIDEPDEVAHLEGLPCGDATGLCEPGATQCVGGAVQCVGGVLPGEEVCDGRDNDCDGLIDNQAQCPAGLYCIEGDCRLACDPGLEFPCPGTLDCLSKPWEEQTVTVCMEDAGGDCGGQVCPEGWICQSDQCVDPCDPNPCSDWEECHLGACVDVSCTGAGERCAGGEFCLDHQCVADPCLAADCDPESQYCVRECPSATDCSYTCHPLCLCAPGETCGADGQCAPDLCADSACQAGSLCNPDSGDCEADPCFLVSCSGGETCHDGACVADPCLQADCPLGFHCERRWVAEEGAPVCVPNDGVYTPGTAGPKYLATGGGGCQCDATGSRPGTGLPLVLGLALLLGLLRRRRSRRPGAAGHAPSRFAPLLVLGLAAALTAGAAGCKLDPWQQSTDGSLLIPDAGPDAAPVDATVDACQAATELCNGLDDDCDGVVDNGFDLQSDAYNCGACGAVCDIPYAIAGCQDATCVLESCLPGHWDVNGDPADGCEYGCFQTNGGVESCDHLDNDCDGQIDEDYDLQTDPLHCGQCNRSCSFFQGVGACQGGQCELDSCRGGFVDKDGDPDNGCECMMLLTEGTIACTENTPGACGVGEVCADVTGDGSAFCSMIPPDLCDGVDNDCDGQVDEDALLPTGGCYTQPVGCTATAPGVYDCVGTCRPGTPSCVGGDETCVGQVGPAAEVCDGTDNDCNGIIDDGYDFQNDPVNCGGCGVRCANLVANAIPGCLGGQCRVVACLPGFWDINADPSDGCEYACSYTFGGVERCGDGVDNDCDGQVDEGFDFTTDPTNCGSCGNDCGSNKPFGTAVVDCLAGACRYQCVPNHYDLNGDLAAGQGGNGCEYACTVTNGGVEICDGVDNDCNGQTDEGFDKQTDVNHCGGCNQACSARVGANQVVVGCASGLCQFACQPGTVDLNGDLALGSGGDGCECTVSNGGVEICDNVDNDCDGQVDEAAGGTPLTQACYTGPAGAENVGPCHGGTQTCAAGSWGTCQGEVHPQPEVCDNLDNDCDGQVDEDAGGAPLSQACYTGPAGTENVGPCHGGTQACTAGGWGACGGQVTPQIEACDSQDNDCDGQTDEDFVTASDMSHCGACNYACAAHVGAFSVSTGCVAGVCQFACTSGHYDLNADVAQGNAGNGCEYACVPTNGGVERCGDSVDNDCDGQTDEGFDFTADPANCGSCGYACVGHTPFGATFTTCSGGTCQFTCQVGYYDLNGDLATGAAGNGCEYACTVSNGGVEACDSLDNDCDGQTDETFNKQTDASNCGSCGYVCAAHAGSNSVVTGCANGVCQFACAPGYIDLNGDVSLGNLGTGCEYACAPSNGGVEICDGQDNDCDGQTDEAAGGGPLTQACYSGPAPTQNVGPCHGGTQTCSGGGWGTCQGEVTPQLETCDNVDNDCDGAVDEAGGGGPLTQACYTGPAPTQNVGLCHGGSQSCTAGAWSACAGQVTPNIEVCDTQDNDCDGQSDEDFILSSDITNCNTCGYSCVAHAGAFTVATGCVAGACQYLCQPNHYDLNGDRASGDAGNGCEYACTPSNGGVEACGDGVDNDCDGQTDEGFNLATDPANCGSCGHACTANTPPGATFTTCAGGVCQFTCQVGYYDLNGDLALGLGGNGCEYACTPSNGGVEICDNVDNDCDGAVDDGFDKQTNVSHCGACNYVCAAHVGAFSTVASCAGGTCQYTCQAGHYDLNGDVSLGDGGNGCEYACTPSNGGVEICDTLDNDCDGLTDEAPSGGPLTRPCYTPGYGPATGCPATGSCTGSCREGVQTCGGTGWGLCQGEVTPAPELCDGQDNDCDTLVDETFTTATDINNCGACGQSCWTNAPANSYPNACVGGACQYTCLGGFNDLNNDRNSGNPPGPANNGCEYTCPVNPPGTEYCDGLDNDCDGAVDEGLTAPVGLCNQGQPGSPCQGVGALCQDPDGGGALPHGWYCQYPASVERDPANPNNLLGYETLCDGADGDCDGVPDDNFNLTSECDNGQNGRCRVLGSVICDPADPSQTTTTCALPAPGTWPTPADEVCDGEDNDCDGLTDENQWQNVPANDPPAVQAYVVDDVVTVTPPSGITTFVYEFEASRPSATPGTAGTGSDARACSRFDVVPWANVTYAQAVRACARAGLRLCQAGEWGEACNGQGATNAYPYGSAYDPTACNGHDQDPGQDAVEPTGTQADCASAGYGAADLSGNLREWTDDRMGFTSAGKAIFKVRGGSFTDYSGGLACDFEATGFVEDVFAPNVGFRCCTTCGNGTIDPGETCDPAPPASSPSCNPVTCGPATCGDGNLDTGEQCDDGNLLPLDGCDAQCQREPENCSSLYPGDEDNDGQANCNDADCAGTWCGDVQDNDNDGFTEANGDCDDTDPDVHPAAPEICDDLIDNNCNGLIDMADTEDKDGDGALACHVNPLLQDCDDWDPDRSPQFFEVPGDGIDNNCNNVVDEPPTPCGACSGSTEYQWALDICDPWWFVSGTVRTGDARGHGCDTALGNSTGIVPLTGSHFLVLSSGSVDAWDGLGTGAQYVQDGLDMANGLMSDPVLGGTNPYAVRDQVQYYMELDVPLNAYSLSFNFSFFSAEYPEYVCTVFNDKFYAIIRSSHPDYAAFSCLGSMPAPPQAGQGCRNISFDGFGNTISVNAAFFENPETPANWSYFAGPNLPGTGYEDYQNTTCFGTTGSPAGCVVPNPCPDRVGGSTAWLTTTANVVPGERIQILFDIHDESDSIYDSRVTIDNFRWNAFTVSGPVTTK